MNAATVIAALAAAAAVLLVLASLKKVPENYSFTVNRWGIFHRTLGPGWHWVFPLVDRVTHRISTVGEILSLVCSDLQTSDRKPLEASGRLYIQVLDPRKAAGRSGDLQLGAIELARQCASELTGQLTRESLQSRTSRELNHWLLGMLNQTSLEWGVRVTRVELSFYDPTGNPPDQADIKSGIKARKKPKRPKPS